MGIFQLVWFIIKFIIALAIVYYGALALLVFIALL